MKKFYLFLYSLFVSAQFISAQQEKIIYLPIEQPDLPILYRGVNIPETTVQTAVFSGIEVRYEEPQKLLHLIFLHIPEAISVDIYNLQGQKMKSFAVEDPIANPYVAVKLDYSSGVYIISTAGRNYSKTHKIYISK